MADTLAVESNPLDHNDGISDRQRAKAFGDRIRERACEIGRTSAEIGRLAGIKKQSMTGYWNGDRLCGSDKLFALADALRVRGRWLVSGEGPKLVDNALVDAADAEFVNLPRYDLNEVRETGKGNRVETVPFRRDWLSRRLLISTGLWLTELTSSYEELGLQEGDVVICSDLPAGMSPPDNIMGIFLGDGSPFVAKYYHVFKLDQGRTGPRVVAADIASGDVQPIARIHARILARL